MNDLEEPFDQIEPRSNRHYPTLLLSRGNLRIFGEGPCGALDRDAIMLTSPQARTLLRGVDLNSCAQISGLLFRVHFGTQELALCRKFI
jgi:hypothetical protein